MWLDCGTCVVRDARLEDIDALPAIADDWEVARYLRDRFPHPYTTDEARAWIERCLADETPTAFAIEVGGDVAGGIGYVLGELEERFKAEIGYWLGRAFQGRGAGTNALRAMTAYIFERHPDIQRIEAWPYSNNPRSMRILEKCGYVREGVLRRRIVKGGEILDSVVYAKLRD